MNTVVAVVVVLVVLAVVAGAVFYLQSRRSRRMRERYGSEYLAAVDDLGDRRRAEAELMRREKRVKSFDIRPLSGREAEGYVARWRKLQADFVDDPGGAIAQADALIGEAMHARGYPVSDFEQRAADLSVDHPKLVADYRIAHQVAADHARGRAGTEDLRRAMIHYRDLFAEVVEPPLAPRERGEPRSFREESEDERAAQAGDERQEPGKATRTDDRPTRPRRRSRRPDDGRTPLV